MTVRAKIAGLLLMVVGTFVAGLAGIKTWENRKFQSINASYEEDRQKSFDSFLERWTRWIEVLANDYSCWDEMVDAIKRQDRAWAETNLDDGTLAASRANAIWVYTKEGALFYARNNLYSDGLNEVPLPAGAISQVLGDRKLCHFFAQTPLGLF